MSNEIENVLKKGIENAQEYGEDYGLHVLTNCEDYIKEICISMVCGFVLSQGFEVENIRIELKEKESNES